MRLFRMGKITDNTKIGIRLFSVYIWNPFGLLFNFRREGYVRFLRLPGIRIIYVVNKNETYLD